MKSISGLIAAVALVLSVVSAGLLFMNTNPRIDAAEQTAITAQQTAGAAMTRADEAYARAERASDAAEMALAAIAAAQRGDSVAIVGIVIGVVALGLFGLLVFLIWDRGEQRKQERLVLQMRAWLYGRLPPQRQYYDIETDAYTVFELPPGKR